MPGLKQIIDALEPIEGGWRGSIPDSWLQGRTSYGGLSAALALHAAQQSDTDLPPLRSALVAFIGPLSGDVMIRASRLRRGRNAAFIQADVESEAGLGLRATFVFMSAVDSKLDHQIGTAPDFPRPQAGDTTFKGNSAVSFAQNFELLDRRDATVGPAE
jgi:acyl-CoA thioesterase